MAYVYKIGLDWDLFIYLFCNNANASCLRSLLLSGGWCSVILGEDYIIWDGCEGVAEKYELVFHAPCPSTALAGSILLRFTGFGLPSN